LDSTQSRVGFTGYFWSKPTSLYLAGNGVRWYDPDTARFTSQDSFLGKLDSPPSLHRYFYANDNPTRYIDPTGHDSLGAHEGGCTACKGAEANEPGTVNDPAYADVRAQDEKKTEDARQNNPSGFSDPVTMGEDGLSNTQSNGIPDTALKAIQDIHESKGKFFDRVKAGGTVAVIGSEVYLSVSVQTLDNGKVLITGTDIHGRKQSRTVAAVMVGLPVAAMVAGKAIQVIKIGEQAAQDASTVEKAGQEAGTLQKEVGAAHGEAGAVEVGVTGGGTGAGQAGGCGSGARFICTSTGDVVDTATTTIDKGLDRELRVAELTGGRVSRTGKKLQDLEIRTTTGVARPDVIGPTGDLIAVGGPAKAKDLASGKLADRLIQLRLAAQENGVAARAYFEEGTPTAVLDEARRVLGADNVVVFSK
jgi:RHS repeat-associated protein